MQLITVRWEDSETIKQVLLKVEHIMILNALNQANQSKTGAAKLLNMKRTTLCMRLRKYHADIIEEQPHDKIELPEIST